VLKIFVKNKVSKICRNGLDKNVKNLNVEKNVKMVSKEMLNILVSKKCQKRSKKQHPVLVV
jgi:hypothetical protein